MTTNTSQISPVWGGGAVHVVVPVADPELLVEAGLVGTHVGNTATVLVTHVEYLNRRERLDSGPRPQPTHHAVELQVGVEPNGSVCAVEVEGDVGEVGPPLLLE